MTRAKINLQLVASEIEEQSGRKLTNRQRLFAKLFVDGQHSNGACARLAGYSNLNGNARIQAHNLLNPDRFPHIAAYISELREDRERQYGVTLLGQLRRLRELSLGAEEAGQFSASINAEVKRSALGGLTVDRRETSNYFAIETMSMPQVEARLTELRANHPSAFLDSQCTDITSDDSTSDDSTSDDITADDTADDVTADDTADDITDDVTAKV
jgi:phage terminase small subunit